MKYYFLPTYVSLFFLSYLLMVHLIIPLFIEEIIIEHLPSLALPNESF